MELRVSSTKNCEIVAVNGRVDSYTAPQLSEALNQVTRNNIYNIILDLSEVTYVSSAGLRVLIDIQKKCKRDNQGDVLLVGIPPRVYETLELTGFTPQFKFFDDVPTAIATFE